MSQTSPATFERHQLMVDERVQGALLWRAGFYGIACALYFIVILIFAEVMSRQDVTFGEAILACAGEAIYWLPGLLLMVPLIAYDMLRQSNRFAGPIFRLRREMQRLIAGESENPLLFREEDYWAEMVEEFNQIRSELLELRKAKLDEKNANAASPRKLFDDSEDDSLLQALVD